MTAISAVRTTPPATENREWHAVAFVALVLLYVAMTVLVDWRFSVDMQVLQDVIAIYPFTEDPVGALTDNSVVIWLVIQFSNILDMETILRLIYLAAFALKTRVLLRYFGTLPTVAFTLLFFFSIDLNQARMSLALSFAVLAWSRHVQAMHLGTAAFLLLAALCHVPGAIFLLLFYIAAAHPKTTLAGLVAMVFGAIALLASDDSPALRYLVYLDIGNDEGTASFFVVTLLLLLNYWQRLSVLQRTFGILCSLTSFYFRELLSLSGRISELTAMAILVSGQMQAGGTDSRASRDRVVLTIGVLFFLYRFTQWVLMGHVPDPSNL